MRASRLVLLLLATGSLIVLLVLRPRVKERSTVRPPAEPVRSATSGAEPLVAPASAEVDAPPREEARTAEAPALPPPAEPVPDGRPVRVVDALGRPVADASVLVLQTEVGVSTVVGSALESDDVLRALAGKGDRYPCDDRGIAHVPSWVGRTVLAVAPGRLGVTLVVPAPRNPDTGRWPPVRIRVLPDRDLRVRLVPDGGAPVADMDVRLEGDGLVPARSPVFLQRSGAEGEVLFRHLPLLVGDSLRVTGAADPEKEAAVALAVPLGEPVVVPLPAVAEDAGRGVDALVVHVPATGSLLLHVVDEDGAPLAVDGTVQLRVVDRDESAPLRLGPTGRTDSPAAASGTWRLLVTKGEARLPHLGVGLDLYARLQTGPEREGVLARFAGPAQAGEERSVELQAGPSAIVLVGHVVDPDGAPLPAGSLEFATAHGNGSSSGSVQTDSEGAFRIIVPRTLGLASPWTLRLSRNVPRKGDPGLMKIETYAFEPGPGPNDLGTIALRPRPLFVAGRVLGQGGEPVAGALVQAGRIYQDPTHPGTTTQWIAFIGWTKSDAQGRFAIHGEPTPVPPELPEDSLRFAVDVLGDGIVHHDPVVFEPGEQDLVIRVEGAGRILYDLELPPAATALRAANRIRATARRGDGTGEAHPSHPLPGSPHDFAFEGLRPGTWDVSFQLAGEPLPMRVIAGVVVPLGAAAEDARLDPVTLPALAVHRLGIRVAEGDPPGRIGVRSRLHGTDGPWGRRSMETVRTDPGGAFVPLLVGRRDLDLLVDAIGYHEVLVESLDGDRDVLLNDGIPVRVAVAGHPLDGLDPDAWLQLGLRSEDNTHVARAAELPRDAPSVDLRVPAPDRYVPVIRLGLRDAPVSVRVPTEDPGARIEVAPDGTSPGIELRIDPARLRALLDGLREQAHGKGG